MPLVSALDSAILHAARWYIPLLPAFVGGLFGFFASFFSSKQTFKHSRELADEQYKRENQRREREDREKHELEEKREKEELENFANKFFNIYISRIKEFEFLNLDSIPQEPFEISGLDRIRDETWKILGKELGQAGENIFGYFIFLNGIISKGSEIRRGLSSGSPQYGPEGFQNQLFQAYKYYENEILRYRRKLDELKGELETRHGFRIEMVELNRIRE